MSKFVAVFKRLKIYILNSGIVVARKLWEKKKRCKKISVILCPFRFFNCLVRLFEKTKSIV
jgi:hypothetical protein